MSSHCKRYPACGCSRIVGTKCHLKDDDPRLGIKEPEFSDEVENKKLQELNRYAPKHRKYPTNYTPPKKRRRK